jgi:hypothetical protein
MLSEKTKEPYDRAKKCGSYKHNSNPKCFFVLVALILAMEDWLLTVSEHLLAIQDFLYISTSGINVRYRKGSLLSYCKINCFSEVKSTGIVEFH